jgi:Sec-independent protein translocase protein TatA
MFDIGFWEFALIGVITLIVVGPERMPAIAKTALVGFALFSVNLQGSRSSDYTITAMVQ